MAQHWKQDTLTSGLNKGREAGDAGMGRQGAKAGQCLEPDQEDGRGSTHHGQLGAEYGVHSDSGGSHLSRRWCH